MFNRLLGAKQDGNQSLGAKSDFRSLGCFLEGVVG